MSYIGTPPNHQLRKITSQSFNGDGSTTVFTLNRSVDNGESLEVFVDNVQQEPGTTKSYTAAGTSLTFSEAPQTGTGNVYVIYRGVAEATTRLEHPPSQALQATTGTFTGNVDINGNELILDADGDTSITADTDDQIDFKTAGSDTMHLTSTGLGIGVTSPARIVDISTTASTSPRLTGTSNNGAYLDFHNNAATTNRFRIGQGYGTSTDNVGFLNNEANADMVFATNNTQRMRIEAGGDRIFYGDSSTRNTEITQDGQLVGGIGARTTSGTTDWNDVTNARSGSGYTLLLGTATNGPGGSYYFHAFSFEYVSKNGSGNITQWAIGYNLNSSRYQRYKYSGTWSSWTAF